MCTPLPSRGEGQGVRGPESNDPRGQLLLNAGGQCPSRMDTAPHPGPLPEGRGSREGGLWRSVAIHKSFEVFMSTYIVASVTLGSICMGILIGVLLRAFLPTSHLHDESKDI